MKNTTRDGAIGEQFNVMLGTVPQPQDSYHVLIYLFSLQSPFPIGLTGDCRGLSSSTCSNGNGLGEREKGRKKNGEWRLEKGERRKEKRRKGGTGGKEERRKVGKEKYVML